MADDQDLSDGIPFSLEPEEELQLKARVEQISNSDVTSILETIAKRELLMLSDERIGNDPEYRHMTMENIAALCAAVERINDKVKLNMDRDSFGKIAFDLKEKDQEEVKIREELEFMASMGAVPMNSGEPE